MRASKRSERAVQPLELTIFLHYLSHVLSSRASIRVRVEFCYIDWILSSSVLWISTYVYTNVMIFFCGKLYQRPPPVFAHQSLRRWLLDDKISWFRDDLHWSGTTPNVLFLCVMSFCSTVRQLASIRTIPLKLLQISTSKYPSTSRGLFVQCSTSGCSTQPFY